MEWKLYLVYNKAGKSSVALYVTTVGRGHKPRHTKYLCGNGSLKYLKRLSAVE